MFTHVEPGHQAIAQEMTEAKKLIRVAVGVDKMFLGSQDRVVIEESVEHINGLADGTGDHLGVEHTVLVRGVRVDRQGLIVVAEVARIERAEQ